LYQPLEGLAFFRKIYAIVWPRNNQQEAKIKMFNRARAAVLVAEYIGTATLVMVALVLTETTGVSYFIGTSLAVTLAVLFLVFGSISGAHLNPALTFGMWTARRIGTLRAVSYIAVQMLAGLTAWQLYQYFTDKNIPAKAVTYSTSMWLAEAVGTFILALGFTAAMTRLMDSLSSAVAIGGAFFVGIMIAATSSAAYLNPAISLGLRGWGTVYILGPLVGGLVGVNLYSLLFAPAMVVKPAASRAGISRTRGSR
jgi:glycerol uptake facilitator-like aquaporin